MITWSVEYYNGGLPLDIITSNDCNWNDLPTDNVIYVRIHWNGYTHILCGMDYYWFDNDKTYGLFNATGQEAIDDENKRMEDGHQEVVYEGPNKFCFKFDDRHIDLGELDPFEGVHILKGVMMPDDEARLIGLII
jgi:hypothetical protein